MVILGQKIHPSLVSFRFGLSQKDLENESTPRPCSRFGKNQPGNVVGVGSKPKMFPLDSDQPTNGEIVEPAPRCTYSQVQMAEEIPVKCQAYLGLYGTAGNLLKSLPVEEIKGPGAMGAVCPSKLP